MIRRVILVLLLLTGMASAARGGFPDGGKAGSMQRPGFSETRRVVGAAQEILGKLRAGEPVVRATPQGQRLMLPLLLGEQAVTYLLIRADGTLAPLSLGPQLPDSSTTPSSAALSSAARTKLAAQVAALTVSGGVEFSGREYFMTLLVGGQPVGKLRLDAHSLQPRLDQRPRPFPDSGGLRH